MTELERAVTSSIEQTLDRYSGEVSTAGLAKLLWEYCFLPLMDTSPRLPVSAVGRVIGLSPPTSEFVHGLLFRCSGAPVKGSCEIEVTPEMIEAGLPHLLSFHRERSVESDVLKALFMAMLAASKTGKAHG